jgi:TetR/AcrR family transcriptional regulator, tetracycline repressor protein
MAKRSGNDALTRDAVVERALQVADAEGLEAVTIRRLGQELGVTPMALYWHVKNKEELLDAMGDRLYADLHVDVAEGTAWDEELRAVLQGLVDVLRRHPTCVDLAFRRIFATPEGRAVSEQTFRLLRQAGFGRRETADIASHALRTAAMLVLSEPGAEPGRTAEDVAEQLARKRAGLVQLPADEFPYIREMADYMLACDDMPAYYGFGIDVFVTGVRSMLAELQPAGR